MLEFSAERISSHASQLPAGTPSSGDRACSRRHACRAAVGHVRDDDLARRAGRIRSSVAATTGATRAIQTSPIWRGGCQGVGVDGHCVVAVPGLMWLRFAGRSERPRVRDGGHAHIRGLGTPRPLFVARPLSKVERGRPGAVAQATNRGVGVREPGCSGRLASRNWECRSGLAGVGEPPASGRGGRQDRV